MTKTLEQAISELANEIAQDEAALRKKKESVNTLCAVDGRAPMYQIEDAQAALPTAIRSDQFYGQPLASAVRTILEMRRQQNLGAASINEIYEALVAGGYLFNTKSEDVSKNSLRNSLAKNTVTFHKLPNGRFGMLSWYPKAAKSGTNEADAGGSEDEEKQEAAVNES
ncbi:MAG: hypothetical protein AB7T86_09685 [Xanthobacteraceae bacterium]|uniref:hypothetical protein n=1 Tax=Pseudolabrys sp. TaxID=1960880 RepID=UPI003D133B55